MKDGNYEFDDLGATYRVEMYEGQVALFENGSLFYRDGWAKLFSSDPFVSISVSNAIVPKRLDTVTKEKIGDLVLTLVDGGTPSPQWYKEAKPETKSGFMDWYCGS